MTGKAYRKGRRKEYELKDMLEENGWVVLRTAGSHGFADLVAIRAGKVRFIQVKPDRFSKLAKRRLIDEWDWITSLKWCEFEVL